MKPTRQEAEALCHWSGPLHHEPCPTCDAIHAALVAAHANGWIAGREAAHAQFIGVNCQAPLCANGRDPLCEPCRMAECITWLEPPGGGE